MAQSSPYPPTPDQLGPQQEEGHASRLLVVAPTRRELGGLRAGAQEGLAVAPTGLGETAGSALASLLAAHHPGLVLSLGFAGGLSPGLETGALVVCDKFLTWRGAEPNGPALLEADRRVADVAAGVLAQAGIAASHRTLLTAPSPLLSPAAKRRAGQETSVAVVDMEGYWLAQTARQRQIPFLALRVVLDPVEQALPRFVATIVADQGRHELRHTAKALLINPFSIAGLVLVATRSSRAQRALRQAVQALVPSLTSPAPALEQEPSRK